MYLVTNVTTTLKHQVVDEMCKYATLLVLSPRHGSVCYNWETRMDAQSIWETIPSHTCLLYVKDPGHYKCTIGEAYDAYLFTVALSGLYYLF